MSQAPGILPSGLGDAVDRDVAKVREATARFKTAETAEAAGYKRVTDCVENQPAGAMGYHFQNNALLDTTLDVGPPGGAGLREEAGRRVQTEWRRIPRADLRLDGRRAAAHHGAGPQEGGHAWASGTSTSGRGSRVRAACSPTGIPTSSAGGRRNEGPGSLQEGRSSGGTPKLFLLISSGPPVTRQPPLSYPYALKHTNRPILVEPLQWVCVQELFALG